MICDQLRLEGFKVLEASSAEDAIAILSTAPVHLVFLDIRVPGKATGLDVARFAQTCRPAPKMLLTSSRVEPTEIAALSLGPIVPKPYPMAHVIALVQRSLDPTIGDGTRDKP
jgi:DNA-binding response OmpR family regulator